MKREIKFRAWDKDTETMLLPDSNSSGDYIWQFNGEGKIQILGEQQVDKCSGGLYHEQYDEWLPIDCELMQYTGLHDKNGKEIYEGDIINVKWQTDSKGGYFQSSDAYCEYEEVVTCEFVCPLFCFKLLNGKRKTFPSSADLEVIGNIYENPELLQTKQNTQ